MIGVILNPHAGYVARHGIDHVRAVVTAAVPDARIHVLVAGDDVGACCRAFRAAGATCIVAAGGDGTVGSVAAHLIGTDTPLGVLPVGTLNHFARDVGVGRDVPAAARALADGCTRIVDAAEVNGHVFVNNSSIGLYAHLVEARERYERQLGKWRALVRAALLTLREGHPLPVRVTADGATGMAETYLLFVGNNRYELDLLRAGRRAALDASELSVFALVETRRLWLVPHFLRALRERPARPRLFKGWVAREVIVTPDELRTVEVACDGEVLRLHTPLVYRTRPRALRVLVPRHGHSVRAG